MKIKHLLFGLALIPSLASAQSVWFPAGSPTRLQPANSTWGIKVPGLAGAGTYCLQVDSTGIFSNTGAACGGAGSTPGGSSGDFQYNAASTFGGTTTPFFLNFSFGKATGTSATTTNFFSTTASSTNFFGQLINGFSLSTCTSATVSLTWTGGSFGCHTITPTAGSITGGAALTKVDDTNVTLTLGGSPSTSLLSAASLTLGWTGTLADSRVADNLTISGGTVDNSVIGGTTAAAGTFTNLLATGSSTLQNFTALNSTTTNATTTSIISTTASTSNFFGAGLTACSGANALQWAITGKFSCASVSGGSASTTLLGDNNAFTGANTFAGLTTLSTTLHTGSTTLQNFTGLNSTTTNATTTTISLGTASTTKLFLSGAGYTTTNCLQVSTAGLVSGTGSACGAGGGGASTTLLTDNNTFSGTNNFAGNVGSSVGNSFGTTGFTFNRTSRIWFTGMSSSLTSDPFVIADLTAGQFRLVIDTSGNVGIGRNVPTEALDVVGKIISTNDITSGADVKSGAASYVGWAGVSKMGSTGTGVINLLNNNGDDFTRLTFGLATSAFPALTKVGQAIVLQLADGTNGGSLGIGTSTPRWPLQVASSTKPQLALSDGTLTSNHWTFRNTGGTLYIATSSPTTLATSTTAAVTIDANGLANIPGGVTSAGSLTSLTAVGIGETSPVAKLQIGTTAGANGGDFYSFSNGLSPRFLFGDSAGAGSYGGMTWDSALKALRLWSTDPAGVGTNQLVLKQSGYTGLNTSAPQWLLDISTSTRSQLTLSDPTSATHLSMRWVGSTWYVASSSDSTYATSTNPALELNTNSSPGLSLATTTQCATVCVGTGANGTTIGSTTPFFMAMVHGSSTPAFSIDSPNGNGATRIGTTTNNLINPSLAVGGKIFWSGSTNANTGDYVCYNTLTGELDQSATACSLSSAKYKTDVQNYTLGLEALLKLRPVTFNFIKGIGQDTTKRQEGFIAEEVNKIDPILVAHDEKGEISGLDYPKFTVMLTKAVQELATKTGEAKRNAEENYQWFILGGLIVWNVILTLKLRKK